MESDPYPIGAQQGAAGNGPVLLPSVAAIAAADHADAEMAQRKQEMAPLPFNTTRLRSYMQRVDSLADNMQQPGAQGSYQLSGFVPDYIPLAEMPASPSHPSPAPPAAGSPVKGQPYPPQDPAAYQAALGELEGIRAEIARVEATLGQLKQPVERTTLGRPIMKKQALLRKAGRREDTFLERKKEWEAAQAVGSSMPVSRGEAVILDQTLEELLPQGLVTASLRTGRKGVAGFDVHLFERQYELVDMVLREAARQVHAGCHERGHLLEKLRTRYNEFFAALKALVFRLQQNYALARTDVANLSEHIQETTAENIKLSESLAQHKTEGEFLRSQRDELDKEFGQHKDLTEEAILHLQGDKKMLERELGHYEELVAGAAAAREEAVRAAVASTEGQLAAVMDERDDLLQRIRFLERQLAKAREDRQRAVPVDHAASQTEDVRMQSFSDDEDSDTSGGQFDEADDKEPSKKKKKKKKKKAAAGKNVGGFGHLMQSDRVGRIKPRGQILKVVAQIYSEKCMTDQVDDRERNPRIALPEFVYDWHLNRYGLRNLADMNLMDLIASCRHWQSTNLKIKLFGQFCGVLSAPYAGSLEHLNFFLYCMQVISSNIMVLFPDAEDAVYWLKPLRVLDVVKIVFPNFTDAAQLREFMAQRVEPLMDSKSKMYDADKVLVMMLEEWQRRTERNVAQLKALFRAGDMDYDGLLTYDEFLSVVRHADPLRSEREIVRMYREALQLSEDGETIDAESFVAVAREHGLSSWKIDYRISGLAQCSTPPSDATGERYNESMFTMLEGVLSSTEDLDDQIKTLKEKVGPDHEQARRVVNQYNFFLQKLKDRDDGDGTWLAYRVLIGEIRASLIRYRGGIKKMVNLVKHSMSMRGDRSSNSNYTSPLMNLIDQVKTESGGMHSTTAKLMSRSKDRLNDGNNSGAPAVEDADTALNVLRGTTTTSADA